MANVEMLHAEHDLNECLHNAFGTAAEKFHNAVAVIDEHKAWTYKKLYAQARRIAHRCNLSIGQSVGIIPVVSERSVEAVAAIIGVLQAGCAYAPIDPDMPSARVGLLLSRLSPRLILASRRCRDKVRECVGSDTDVLTIEDFLDPAKPCESDAIPKLSNGHSLAYVIHTSGSTGVPKGVMVEHRSVTNLCSWHLSNFDVKPREHVAHFSSLAFDASVWELFPYLLNGNTVHLISESLRLNPRALNDYFEEHAIRLAFLPTAVCEQFLELQNRSLRFLLTGGDRLTKAPPENATYTLCNNYGPTETCVVATSTEIRPGTKPSIGKPIAKLQIHVLDGEGRNVESGQEGELYVSGVGVARGYVADPELTAKKFVFVNGSNDDQQVRAYRTGDRVKQNADGTLNFLGRDDAQVKLRGFRVELGDIESVVLKNAEVKDCCAVLSGGGVGKQVSVVVVCATADLPAAHRAILRAARRELPPYMVPAELKFVAAIPLTTSGKKDRRAVAAALTHTREELKDEEEYEGHTERTLAEVWKELLAIGRISATEDLRTLGATSLSYMQLLGKIEGIFGKRLSFREVFTASSIRAQAMIVNATALAVRSGLVRAEPYRSVALLSAAQKQIWIADRTAQSTRYSIPIAKKIRGKLDLGELANAFRKLIERHESLRTNIVSTDKSVVQRVVPFAEANRLFEIEVVTSFDALERDANRPFSLEVELPIRVKVLYIAALEHVLYVNVHHAFADAWSAAILFHELGALYNAALTGARHNLGPLPLQFVDYASWESANEAAYRKDLEFWCGLLRDAPHVLNMPTDKPRPPSASGRGGRVSFPFSEELADALRESARYHHVTPAALLLACTYTLLRRYAGQGDMCIGTIHANRSEPETHGLIGAFVNTLALRLQTKEGSSVAQVVKVASDALLKAHEHHRAPFSAVVEKLKAQRDPSRNPIVQVMFNVLQSTSSEKFLLNGCTVEKYNVKHDASPFDLAFIFDETSPSLEIQFSSDLFHRTSICRLGSHFIGLLEEMTGQPEESTDRLAMTSIDELALVTRKFNDGFSSYPQDATLAALFDCCAEMYPHKVAVVQENKELTYGQLMLASKVLASRLRKLSIYHGARIGVFMHKSMEAIVSMLAVVRLGAVYVPLDPNYPFERISYIIGDSDVTAVLSRSDEFFRTVQDWPMHVNVERVDIVELLNGSPEKENDVKAPEARDLAYVMYTSGSTGKPKGVMVEHQAIVRLVKNTNYVEIGAEDVILQASPLAFDASTFEIWGALTNGALLAVAPEGRISVHELGRTLQRHRVSIAFFTSLLFKALVQEAIICMDSLRVVIAGGEKTELAASIQRLYEDNPTCVFVHAYGPTENTTFTTCFTVPRGFAQIGSNVPIGRPISHGQVFILEPSGLPCPVGVPGRLYAAGDGLARGYVNKPELTDERFVSKTIDGRSIRMYDTGDIARWLPDGNIEFIGREDGQVKVRGHRIELSEIESALAMDDRVRDVAVVLHCKSNGTKSLVAYYVASREGQLGCDEHILRDLSQRLPEYMLPTAILRLPKLPATSNGKVDKKLLEQREVSISAAQYSEPENQEQATLTSIWAEVLEIARVGICDDFFRLGGDSIRAIIMVNRARQHELLLEVADVFSHPTIDRILAHYATVRQQREKARHVKPKAQMDRVRPTPIQRRILKAAGANLLASNVDMVFEIVGPVDHGGLRNAWLRVLERHEALSYRLMKNRHNGQFFTRAMLPDSASFRVVDLTGFTSEAFELACVEERRRIQNSGLDPFSGKMAQLVCLAGGDLHPDRLILAIHHLVTDSVSWRILIDELSTEIESGAGIEPESTSFAEWTERLHDYTSTPCFARERMFWVAQAETLGKLPRLVDCDQSLDVAQEVVVAFNREQSKILLNRAAESGKRLTDLLLGHLAEAQMGWSGIPEMGVLLQAHGREALFEGVDLGRTVGAFTTFFPLFLPRVPSNASSGFAGAEVVARAIAEIPRRGLGFGLLADEVEVTPEFAFNYMGAFSESDRCGRLIRVENFEQRRFSQELTQAPISVVGMQFAGEIKVAFGHTHVLRDGRDIATLANAFSTSVLKSIT